MSHQEEKISKFLDYPYDSFLMLRLEFMLIFKDELIAKVLRIIEKEIETERKRLYRETVNKMGTTPTGVVDITKDIYVSISYKTFMSDLFDTVTSENTLKRAVKELEKTKVIFRRHNQKQRYDAPEYKIHQPVLQMLLSLLKKPGYQNLIPSTIEALKKLHPHEMTPSECQSLIPSIEDLSTNSETRVSKFDPNYNNSNTNNSNNKEVTSNAVLSDDKNSDTPASFSLQEMIAYVQANGYNVSQGSSPDVSTPQATAVENPGQLADSSTVSLPGDNGVRESLQPLSTSEHVNTSPLTPEPLAQLSPTSQNEVVQASNGQSPIAAVATGNLDEEHAALSQSGENATASDGDTPTESGASESVPAETTKRTRKPAEKKEGPTKAQIDAVYVVFDELFRETMETPDPDFSCTHTKTSTEAIKELITRKATPARLRAVFKDMWDEDRDGVYWWRSHGHMTIKAVCNNYGARVLSLESARGKVSAKDKPVNAKTVLEALTATSSYQPLQFAQPRPLRKAE